MPLKRNNFSSWALTDPLPTPPAPSQSRRSRPHTVKYDCKTLRSLMTCGRVCLCALVCSGHRIWEVELISKGGWGRHMLRSRSWIRTETSIHDLLVRQYFIVVHIPNNHCSWSIRGCHPVSILCIISYLVQNFGVIRSFLAGLTPRATTFPGREAEDFRFR
jgi:hypothetical protein